MEKRRAHYPLRAIKVAFADPAKLNRTYGSRQGADALAMDDADVVAVVQALTVADFDKSMTSYADHRIWQDVYRPVVGGDELYVKFTVDAEGAYVLISFKKA